LTTSRRVMGVSGYMENLPQGQKWLCEGHMLRVLRGKLLVHVTVPDYKNMQIYLSSKMSCHVMSCHVMSCHVMSCHVMSCHVMSCHVMSCHVMSCPIRKGLQSNSMWKITPIETRSTKRVLYSSYV